LDNFHALLTSPTIGHSTPRSVKNITTGNTKWGKYH
jgi:hypothetical protein